MACTVPWTDLNLNTPTFPWMHATQILFFEGLYFSNKLNIKNLKSKQGKLNLLWKRRFHQEQSEGLGRAWLPQPSKTSAYWLRKYWTHCFSEVLNSHCRILTEGWQHLIYNINFFYDINSWIWFLSIVELRQKIGTYPRRQQEIFRWSLLILWSELLPAVPCGLTNTLFYWSVHPHLTLSVLYYTYETTYLST